MTDTFALIAAERRATADMVEGLTDAQRRTSSLCAGWTVRDVAAHLTMPFSVSLPSLMVKMLVARFDFAKVSDQWARANTTPIANLGTTLRTNAEHRFTPPGFGPEAPLTDIVVHTQDMALPLGIDRAVPDEAARVVLDFIVTPKAGRAFVGKGVFEGLALCATDLGWSHGTGAAVQGPARALILAGCGRTAALAELTGPGVEMLQTRVSD